MKINVLKISHKRNLIILALLIISVLLLFLTFTVEGKSNKEELKLELQHIIDRKVKNTELPAVAVQINGSKFGDFSFTSGKSSLNSTDKIKKESQFKIGSITKSFTAAAILKLYEEGKLDLDEKIIHYLDLNYDKYKKITVRNLLNMSSGLGDYLRDTDKIVEEVIQNPEKEFLPKYLAIYGTNSTDTLKFEPGSQFDYSNTNYILLAMIIENRSGLSYEEYIRKNFINKYNFNGTIITKDLDLPNNLARGYFDSNGDGNLEDWTEVHPSYVWSAGEIISTASDIAKWLDLYISGKLFRSKINEEIYRGTEIAENIIYTTGLSIENNRIGHNGTVIGYHSDVWHNKDLGITVSVLSNVSGKEDYTRQLVNEIFAIFNTKN